MARLDIGKSAFSGFKVIGRAPLAPVVWGIVTTVLAVLPLLLVLPAFIDFFQLVVGDLARGIEPDEAEVMRLSTQLNIVQPLSWITQLLATGLVTGAIIRAVLHPEQKSWFYMRLGMAEVMLVAVSLVYTIILVVAFVVAALLVVAVAFAVGAGEGEAAGVAVGVLLGLVVMGVVIWGGLRFSLGFAMSHDRKQFLLFESWKMTKGHAGGLFGMALLSVIVSWLISAVIVGLLMTVGAILVLGNGGFEALSRLDETKDFAAFFTPERTQALIGFGSVYLLIATLLQGYLMVVITAPWAEAYRQLGTEDTVAA